MRRPFFTDSMGSPIMEPEQSARTYTGRRRFDIGKDGAAGGNWEILTEYGHDNSGAGSATDGRLKFVRLCRVLHQPILAGSPEERGSWPRRFAPRHGRQAE